MSRVERHALVTLGGLIVLESTLGLLLRRVVWAHTSLFLVDGMLGVFVLAFALSVHPDDPPRR